MAASHIASDGRLTIGLDSNFDNAWSHAHGIDLRQPGDTKLRAAESYAIARVWNQVYVRPNADGINDLPYRSYDD